MTAAPRPSYWREDGGPPLTETTIPAHLAAVADRFADREAVVGRPQGRRLTFGDLMAEADTVARGLLGLGFSKGDRIGVWSTDNVEWVLMQLATARIGAILVNVNPAYTARELAYALERVRMQGLFVIPAFRRSNYVETLKGVVAELAHGDPAVHSAAFPDLKRVVVFDPADPLATERPAPGFTTWAEMAAAADGVEADALDAVEMNANDPINIQFTSGTTGNPKPVLLSHRNILNNALDAARIMGFTERDRLCVPVPFYHCFGMVLANLLCFSVGACLVIPAEHFDAGAVLDAIEAEKCTAVHGVPTMFIAELEHENFAETDLSSLRTGIMAGAPCPEPLMKRVIGDMHCPEILIGYGQTEASPLTHLTRRDDSLERRTRTVGRNLAHQEVKVISTETGETVPVGETGEVCFRGYHVMLGYYGDEDATRKAIDADGWLHSGDLGAMDEDGYVRITGRLKDMIIRGGENIYPAEIEAWLFEHPKIAQAAVFGVADEKLGERVVAWVQLHGGEKASEQELKDYCAEGLAHFKVPETIRLVDDFPMTVTGKLQKFRMREIEEGEGRRLGT
jgi:fatty-acyl-CoA synthase